MLDGTSVLWVNLPLVGTVGSQSKKYETGVKIKATGDTKLNDSPVYMEDYIHLMSLLNFLSIGMLHARSSTLTKLYTECDNF